MGRGMQLQICPGESDETIRARRTSSSMEEPKRVVQAGVGQDETEKSCKQ